MKRWLFCVLLFSSVLTLYSASLGHAFLFDEENIILKNPYLQNISSWPELFKNGFFYMQDRAQPLWTQYYRPLTALSFAVDFFFWRGDSLGYSLTSVFLHGFVVILLFLFLDAIQKNRWAAFLAALFYAVHTAQTEAVTYVASRSDTLSGVFILSILLCYWHSRWVPALLLFISSLFIKESMVLVPIYLFILEKCFFKTRLKEIARKLAPFAAALALFLFFRKFICPVPLGPDSVDWGGAVLRAASSGALLVQYTSAIIFPEPFKFGAGVLVANQLFSSVVLLTVFLALAAVIIGIYLRKNDKCAFFGLLFFGIAFFPSLQIIPYVPQWAEHYLYLPLLGLSMMLTSFFNKLLGLKNRIVVAAGLIIYFLFLSFLCVRTWQRNSFYMTPERFYTALAHSDSPFSFYGHQNLGKLYLEEEDWKKAEASLKKAVSMAPHSDTGHAFLGRFYMKKRDFESALLSFQTASSLDTENNEFRVNVGNAFVELGRYKEADAVFQGILQRNPKYWTVYLNLITLYELMGEADRAIEWGREALKFSKGENRESAMILMAMVRAAYRDEQDDKAKDLLEEILRVCPGAPWYEDVARLLLGQITEEVFTRIVETKYDGFQYAARNYILISRVWLGKKEAIASFLKENQSEIDDAKDSKPLFLKEINRAKRVIEEKL